MKTAYLILENGISFKGYIFGAEKETIGEIVFTTAMTGYLETLTDPSYYGQIVVQTFPLIGNYGVIPEDFESEKISLFGYIVKYPCHTPSNFRSIENLDTLLKKRGITGLCGIDTRMLTRIIRNSGVLNGKITCTEPVEKDRLEAAAYIIKNPVENVSGISASKTQNNEKVRHESKPLEIALLDFGSKGGIMDALNRRNCRVICFPSTVNAAGIMKIKPSGIILSNGPGDPSDPGNEGIINTIRVLDNMGIPIFGICLGHQLLALARGLKTKKMKFGHRGSNQPVKDISSGRVYITSQNHGYSVAYDSGMEQLNKDSIKESFVNVNDGTNEGLDYGSSFSVQFHPEAQGGPLDTSFLFDIFLDRVQNYCSIIEEGQDAPG